MQTGRGRDGESTHEILLEHVFDEHLFDTIASSGPNVQHLFEQVFE